MNIEQCFQPRLCCCRGDHWPLAVAWWRVNKQSWPRQISRTELWTVPRSQLFAQPRPEARPQQPAEMIWKCHLMYCIPETSVCVRSDCVKPSSIILFVVQHAAIRCDASAECRLKGISVHRAAAPGPGLASLAWRGHEWGHRVTGGYPDWASVSVSPCSLYPHTTRPSPVSGGGEIKISWYLHTHSIQHHQQRRTADR